MDLSSLDGSVGTLPPRSRFTSSLGEQSLNGDWRFRMSPSLAAAPAGVEAEDFDDSAWTTIPVPSSWPMQGHGSPIYTNVQYPWPVDPPYVPDENQIGDHRLVFDAEDSLLHGAVLRFDGVDNIADVWLNGTLLGTTRGSRLPNEFDVGALLRASGNVLVVRVARWSAQSYLEDQDMWWLPGIFRDVTLLAKPDDAINDIVVRADYADGDGTITVEVDSPLPAKINIAELGVEIESGKKTVINKVTGWTAEQPKLYDLTVSTERETVVIKVGFRTVSVVDAQLLINGRPIIFRGVNRHEHHPDLGRVIPRDVVEHELRMMKQYNINAIRTSHYAPHPILLELADELGFYVIDECDLETHGFGMNKWRRNPVADPAWRPGLIQRMSRLVHRDRNHPSVVIWSLGNESGTGENLAAMAAAAREIDDSRLIHYEGDWDSTYVDVYSRMYAPADEVKAIGEGTEQPTKDPAADAHRRRLPFIQCEYNHAMGNGPGGMSEYQELFERYPRLAGGFVWEWLEHGIRKHAADGTEYFGYGGDFGESVHDGNFVCDGLVNADREPRPGLIDLKKVYEPVALDIGADWQTITVTNKYAFSNLDHLRLDWAVEDADGRYAAGVLDRIDVAAREQVTAVLPAEIAAAARPGAILTVSARLAADTDWASAGHELAWGQAGVVRGAIAAGGAEAGPSGAPVLTGDGVLELGPGRFSPVTGRLVAFDSIPVDGPQLTLWRSPTDNDNGMDHRAKRRESAGWLRQRLDKFAGRVVAVTEIDDDHGPGLQVVTRYAAASFDRYVDLTITWRSDGNRLSAAVSLRPNGDFPPSWPRIGLDFVLDGAADRVSWAGYGPGQKYPDTGQGARRGYFTSSVADLQVPYTRPQENGARWADRITLTGGVRDLTISSVRAGSPKSDRQGAPDGFAFSLRPWSQRALDAADHTPDLVPDGRTYLTIDHRQQGIGTASCGPGVLEAYRLDPAALTESDLSFEFVLS